MANYNKNYKGFNMATFWRLIFSGFSKQNYNKAKYVILWANVVIFNKAKL